VIGEKTRLYQYALENRRRVRSLTGFYSGEQLWLSSEEEEHLEAAQFEVDMAWAQMMKEFVR